MNQLHELEMKRNSAIYMLKQMRSEGAFPVHIGQQKKVIKNIDAEISILKAESNSKG